MRLPLMLLALAAVVAALLAPVLVSDAGRRSAIATVAWWVAWASDDVAWVTPRAVAARVAQGEAVGFVDARSAGEWTVSRLPAAVHVDVGDLPPWLGDLRREPLVLYDALADGRAVVLARRLRREGFDGVAVLRGGLTGWAAGGGPLVDGAGRPTTAVVPPAGVSRWLVERSRRAPPAAWSAGAGD